ncbi:MAG: ADP-ribosylglycohydrolase family protein [Bryobacteraceae bacterium]
MKRILTFLTFSTLAAAQTRPLVLSRSEYEGRVHGAWMGQVIGTLAGLPFEGRPASSPLVRVETFNKPYQSAPIDDDYYYEYLALLGFEKYGIGMTADQLGQVWKEHGAGAFGSSNEARIQLAKGVPGSQSGHPRYNRYWWTIGPQFSADIYGMIAPGDPNLAGRLARTYGHVNGYAEGADGAVFIAGMVSLAFRESDPKAVVRQAARLIHPASPYRQCLDMVISMAEKGAPPEKVFRAVEDRWRRQYDRVNNGVANGGLVAASVWFGGGDYLETVNLAFRAADFSDADCNAANAGAVAGALKGIKALPAALADPLHDRITGARMGRLELKFPVDESISGIARRVAAVGLKMLAAHNARVSDAGITVPYRAIATQPAELFQAADYMQYWNPDWKLERAAIGETYLDGDVLITGPAAESSGVLLRRRAKLGPNPGLEIEAGAGESRGWLLEATVNNEKILERRIEGPGVKIEADLSRFSGQEVELRLFQRGPSARWKGIRLR